MPPLRQASLSRDGHDFGARVRKGPLPTPRGKDLNMSKRFDAMTDREILGLRDATERERMTAHHAHDDYRHQAAKKKLREIDNEISRRREKNRENRKRAT